MRLASSVAVASLLLFAPALAQAQDGPSVPPPMDPNQPGGAPGQPTPATTQEAATNQELDTAEHSDSGRNFELIWIDASAGASYINMEQLSSSTFQIEKSKSGGPAFSLGAGVRFVVLILGAQLRYNALSAFNMWQINGQVGLKFPVSKLDILLAGHGGYSFVGSLGDASVATNTNTPTEADKVKIRGFNAGLDFGIDYFLTSVFSIGAGAYADFLFLSRPPAPLPAAFSQLPADQQAKVKSDPLYANSGSSVGLELGGGLRLGLHFGL